MNSSSSKKSIVIQGIPLPYINAIRRILLSDIPCCAIDTVEFIENNTPYRDEYLAHRIGLLPIRSSNSSSSSSSVNDDDVFLSLNVAVPKTSTTPKTVTSGDFFIVGSPAAAVPFSERDTTTAVVLEQEAAAAPPVSEDGSRLSSTPPPAMSPMPLLVHDDIPIATLGPGQALHLRAYLAFGTAAQHAKWSVVSAVEYKIIPTITITSDRLLLLQNPAVEEEDIEDIASIVRSCPAGVFGTNSSSNGGLEVQNPAACVFCKRCLTTAGPGELSIAPLPATAAATNVMLTVRSIGQYSPEQCLALAYNILREQILSVADYLLLPKKQ